VFYNKKPIRQYYDSLDVQGEGVDNDIKNMPITV